MAPRRLAVPFLLTVGVLPVAFLANLLYKFSIFRMELLPQVGE
jgi:hypothetical protein